MSITNGQKPITKQDLSDFYQGILPYLGGSADAGFTPVGTVIPMIAETAPANYLICDGTAYNKSDYPELAKHLLSMTNHSMYEVSGDSTKFKVPDLRGEFMRMTGTNSHANQGSGADVGVHQDGTENISCFIGWTGAAYCFYADSNMSPSKVDNSINIKSNATRRNIQAVNDTSTGNQTMYTSRPTNTSFLFCIATKNIYLNPSNDYSTDEKVVGTWIDGKPIYQKTIVDTMPTVGTDGTSVTKYIQLNSSVDKVIKCEGVYQVLSNNFIPFEGSYDSSIQGKAYFVRIYVAPNSATTPNNANKLLITSNQLAISEQPCYVTIQYTKTTS